MEKLELAQGTQLEAELGLKSRCVWCFSLGCTFTVLWADVTRHHRLDGLEQQKGVLTVLWAKSLKSVSRAVLLLKACGETPSCPSSFWWLRHPLARGYVTLIFASVFTGPPPLLPVCLLQGHLPLELGPPR